MACATIARSATHGFARHVGAIFAIVVGLTIRRRTWQTTTAIVVKAIREAKVVRVARVASAAIRVDSAAARADGTMTTRGWKAAAVGQAAAVAVEEAIAEAVVGRAVVRVVVDRVVAAATAAAVVVAEEEVVVEAEVAAVVAEAAEDRRAAASTATNLVTGEIQPRISPVRLQRAQRASHHRTATRTHGDIRTDTHGV
jgi:hypothetical protein